MRKLVLIIILSLMAGSPAFARKATRHYHFNRANYDASTKPNEGGGFRRHPDDVALDRKIRSICRGC